MVELFGALGRNQKGAGILAELPMPCQPHLDRE